MHSNDGIKVSAQLQRELSILFNLYIVKVKKVKVY